MYEIENYIYKTKATKNLSQKTIAAYTSDLHSYERFCGSTNLRSACVDDICKYVGYLSSRGLKDSTIKRKIITLQLFYNYLFKENLIAVNPFFQHKFSFKQEQRLPKTLTIKEVSLLLSIILHEKQSASTPFSVFENTRDLCLIDLIISTGIRIGEAASIELSDIIPHEHTILIHGKGRKQRLLYISSQDTWNHLKSWLSLRKELGIKATSLFVNRYFAPITIYGIENIFKKYKRLSRINEKATPHYLRHTFATNLLSNGADLRSVQEILGHANISTTEIYTEITMKRKKQVLSKYNYRNKL